MLENNTDWHRHVKADWQMIWQIIQQQHKLPNNIGWK